MEDTSKLINKIDAAVVGCYEMEVIQPAQIGRGDWQDGLHLFVKPEVFLVDSEDQVKKSLGLILAKLAAFEARAAGVAIVGGQALDRLEIMSQHYGFINQLSRSASRLLAADDKKRVGDMLEIAIADYDILGGHEYLAQYPGETTAALDALWFEGRSTKIRSGFYVRSAAKEDRKIVLVNAFHPEQLAHYTTPSHRLVLILVHSNTNWSTLKNQMVGATFPDQAAPQSIRGTLYAQPTDYGFESVSIANNVVHLSAGPFEAMYEIVNFFGKLLNLDPAQQPPLALRRMIEETIDLKQALGVLDNPILTGEAKSVDLFTATEDMDTQDALALWKQNFLA